MCKFLEQLKNYIHFVRTQCKKHVKTYILCRSLSLSAFFFQHTYIYLFRVLNTHFKI